MTSQEKVVATQRVNSALIDVQLTRDVLDAATSEWADFASFVALIPASLQPLAAVESKLQGLFVLVMDAQLMWRRAVSELSLAREARSTGIDAVREPEVLSDDDKMRVMKCVTDALEGDGWLFDHATFETAMDAAGFAIVRVSSRK